MYSSLPAVEGVAVAVNFVCAPTLTPKEIKKSKKNILVKNECIIEE